jgi:hypothetical protein
MNILLLRMRPYHHLDPDACNIVNKWTAKHKIPLLHMPFLSSLHFEYAFISQTITEFISTCQLVTNSNSNHHLSCRQNCLFKQSVNRPLDDNSIAICPAKIFLRRKKILLMGDEWIGHITIVPFLSDLWQVYQIF